MIDATLFQHPEAMCDAVKELAKALQSDRHLLRSRIRSGLKEEVCACVCAFMCAHVHVHVCLWHVCTYAFNWPNHVTIVSLIPTK